MLYRPEMFEKLAAMGIFKDQTESSPEQTTDPSTVVARFQAATTEEQKNSIAETWLLEFASLSEYFGYAQRNTSAGRDVPIELAKIIFSGNVSIERCQLFSQLFSKCPIKPIGFIFRLICFLQKSLPQGHNFDNPILPSYDFRTISTSELKLVVAIIAIDDRDALQIVERLARIIQLSGFYLEKTPISDDRINFIKIFSYYLWGKYFNERYFTDEVCVKFFNILQMPDENFQRLLKIKEALSREYFEFFILRLVNRYSADEISAICDPARDDLLNAMPYLILIDGLDTLKDLLLHFPKPVIQNFIQEFRQHELLNKGYSATLSSRNHLNENDRSLNDFSWDIQTLELLSQRSRKGITLFSALSQVIAKSKGAALRTLKQCLVPRTEKQLKVLETMVFDYPDFCEELRRINCTLGEEETDNSFDGFDGVERDKVFDLEENFVTFSRFDNKDIVKQVLRHPAIARLCLFNPGRRNDHYQTLVREGVFDVLLDAETQNLQTLSHLLELPNDDGGMDNYFFDISALVFAHKTVVYQDSTLLWAILTADLSRYKMLCHCINLFQKQYGKVSSASDYGTLCIRISKDMIETELMQTIFLLNVPAHLENFKKLTPAQVIAGFIEEWVPLLQQSSNKLQLVGLKMLLNVIGTHDGAQTLNNIIAVQQSVEATLEFFANEVKAYINQCKERLTSLGWHGESKDESVLKYLLDKSEQTQSEFNERIIEIGKDISELDIRTNESRTTQLL